MILQGINHRELNAQVKELEREGYHLTNFLALHTFSDFQGKRKDYVLRTLLNHHGFKQMAYLFIVDQNGKVIVNLTSGDEALEAFRKVSEEVLTAMVFVQHSYTTPSGDIITEFAKPIFFQGQKIGTIRLGLFNPRLPGLTLEKVSLLATIGFYILSAAIVAFLGYSGILRSLTRLRDTILSGKQGPVPSAEKNITQGDITQSLNQIQASWFNIQEQCDKINVVNQELTTRLSVLHFENAKTEAILDHLNIGIMVTDTENTIIQINAYLLNLFCLSREAAIDQPALQVLVHPDVAVFAEYLSRTEYSSNPQQVVEVKFSELAPGESFLLSHTEIGEKKHPIGKLFMLKAATREKRLEKATKDFTAHLSHELLTPLTTIHSYSEMLADDEVSGVEMRKEFINTINEETHRLARLIKDILNFSKLEGGTLTLNKGLVRSDWLFEDSLNAIEGAARKKNITIQKILPDNLPTLIGDKEQLKGCIINILGNAVKYTGENGKIQFELSELKNMVVFDIRDSGCGIAEEDLPFIFDKFFRSGRSEITMQQGTGLGLAIAAEIVSLHDGSIDVQSRLDEGTHFSIKIPKEEYYLGEEDQSVSRRRRIAHPASH